MFTYDKPIKYDCGSTRAVILTEKGKLYKINLDTKGIEEIKDQDSHGLGIVDIACGSDYIMALKSDGNLYTMGKNKCGQLGVGDY